ncbi:hypothetical protein E6P09_10695 [Haloferax mediterranei ATCC 33500]|uniref:DUF7965 domain-containing protein n=1 Tax=Haloferax mediterranei (strain ATCC 33500 / DSM 1411 / JCM 8866 / NBRC 14739 / NCIMB 2177 / R-4) TaxID=523841 RepID=I3R4S8_HALMT|nr:hypothetical protein [Haloferax mediterranei]AFK19238.1 hypothetical protein HFX_1531 [Haloferax mediterranei ATCC 33500]AHZ21400.1 hypothetical protein BM92_01470 [Haloferax mediterranei ATCC 33500]EMA03857.1 hypothetical protein C439_02828 [Haloferax mediterranei ATCC 33500]MDX5989340.1 hypothetical protein [Haloferax mediterranei ATCC 33500]QCQ75706.1 hypothetical protein E6P09_10695 [Haloferax mediterranei ATCC 33500]
MGDADSFEVWVVSTFNLVILSLVLLFIAHTNGGLAGSLSGFGTLPGVLVFGYLWVLAVASTRRSLRAGGLDDRPEGGLRSLAWYGFVGGARIGSAFVLGIVVVLFLIDFLLEPTRAVSSFANLAQNISQVASFALIVLFVGSLAGIIGGVIGGLSVLLDAGLYGVATRLTGPATETARSNTGE